MNAMCTKLIKHSGTIADYSCDILSNHLRKIGPQLCNENCSHAVIREYNRTLHRLSADMNELGISYNSDMNN